jgi:hypothetical protein
VDSLHKNGAASASYASAALILYNNKNKQNSALCAMRLRIAQQVSRIGCNAHNTCRNVANYGKIPLVEGKSRSCSAQEVG